MVFDPTPAWKSPSWLLPALGAALAACLLTGLLWRLPRSPGAGTASSCRGTAALLWSARVAWTTARPMAARTWTLILAISSLILLYTAVIYHLMSFVTKY